MVTSTRTGIRSVIIAAMFSGSYQRIQWVVNLKWLGRHPPLVAGPHSNAATSVGARPNSCARQKWRADWRTWTGEVKLANRKQQCRVAHSCAARVRTVAATCILYLCAVPTLLQPIRFVLASNSLYINGFIQPRYSKDYRATRIKYTINGEWKVIYNLQMSEYIM